MSPDAPRCRIEAMRPSHWGEVQRVYLEGIETRNATFETEAPSWESWDKAHRPDCRLTAWDDSGLVGWAAITPVSTRCVYEGVGDLSVYVAGSARGRGVGRLLLATLIEASERAGIWTLQAGIFPENAASVRLHKSLGFREVGRRERIGRMDGVWRDVLLLERRSAIAGRS